MNRTASDDVHGFSRRAILVAGVGTAAFAVAPGGVAHAAAPRPRRTVLFDDGWRFWRGEMDGGERPALDDRGWSEVQLPHDWSIEDMPGAPKTSGDWTPPVALWSVTRVPKRKGNPFFGDYPDPSPDGPPLKVGPFDPAASGKIPSLRAWMVGGIGWYRKTFTAPQLRAGERAEIQFDGAFFEAEVWLNGVNLGKNVYGFGAFAFDMTPHLKPGGINVLAVRVSNVGVTARWYTGSGINRHVRLNLTGPVRIAPWGAAVSTPTVTDAAAEVAIDVELENHLDAPAFVRVAAILRDAGGRKVGKGEAQASLPASGKGVSRIAVRLPKPRLWSPDAPNLYTADVSIATGGRVTDECSTRFGVRSIAVSAKSGLTINGRQIKLKGACVHAAHGILGAVAIDRAEFRKAELLKKYGYNAVRLGHQMFPQAFLDACDELGLIVIDEVFDAWEKPKVPDDYAQYFKENWHHDLTRMIRQDRNHPSVVFWSIGNEIPERNEPSGVAIAAKLRELVLSLDRSRPITAAINGPTGKEGKPARRSIDVVGYNYQLPSFAQDHIDYPDMVMMSTEQWAADIHDGWRLTQANPWMLGEFVWSGFDYLGEVGVGGSELKSATEKRPDRRAFAICLWDYPAFLSGCGEIDLLGRRKPQGLYRDVLWENSSLELLVQRPPPEGTFEHIGPWGWHDELQSWTWPDYVGKPMTVRAYTSGDEVRLLLNGQEVGRKSVATPADELTASFEVPYAPGELVAVAYRGGHEIARQRLETVGTPARIQLSAERSRIAASPNDLAYVFAEVLDGQDRKVPDAQVPLTFSIEGEGRLRATGSANPRGIKSFTDPRTLTFHGEALAIVQAGYTRGRARVRVSSPGLTDGAVTLRIG